MWSGYDEDKNANLVYTIWVGMGNPGRLSVSLNLTAGLSFNPFTSLFHGVKFQSNPTSLSTLVVDFAMKCKKINSLQFQQLLNDQIIT